MKTLKQLCERKGGEVRVLEIFTEDDLDEALLSIGLSLDTTAKNFLLKNIAWSDIMGEANAEYLEKLEEAIEDVFDNQHSTDKEVTCRHLKT